MSLYASWNGATDVAAWRVLAGSAPGALAPIGAASYPTQGFQTTIAVATADRYVSVQALSATGAVLGISAAVDTGGSAPAPAPSASTPNGGTVAKVP